MFRGDNMPDRFPLEHFNRTYHPDAWFEYWQDNDFYHGPSELRDQPLAETIQEEPDDISYSPWSDTDFYG